VVGVVVGSDGETRPTLTVDIENVTLVFADVTPSPAQEEAAHDTHDSAVLQLVGRTRQQACDEWIAAVERYGGEAGALGVVSAGAVAATRDRDFPQMRTWVIFRTTGRAVDGCTCMSTSSVESAVSPKRAARRCLRTVRSGG
jgi:hypothetical protein